SDYSIPKNAPNKEAAWKYLKFYCLEAPEIFAESKGVTPANILTMDPADQQKVGKILFDYPHFDQATGMKTFVTNKMELKSELTTISTAKNEITDLVKNEVTSSLQGNETPAQA